MNRRELAAALLASAVPWLKPMQAAPANPFRRQFDPERKLWFRTEMICPVNSSCFFIRHYEPPKRIPINFDEPDVITPGVILDDPKAPATPVGDQPIGSQADLDQAVGQAQATDPDVAIDPDTTTFDHYQFGAAGLGAAATAVGYGIAASIAGLGAQAGRIDALRQEIVDLEAAIAQQRAVQADAMAAVESAIADRSQTLAQSLGAVAELPRIGAANPLLAVADGHALFATPDPFLAIRLHRTARGILDAPFGTVPGALRDAGLAAVRQADVESATGSREEYETFIGIARTVADVGIGLDPITGAARSLYELVTGENLVTGATLSNAERGIAALNVMLLGGCSTATRGITALGKLGRVVAGVRGQAIINLATEVAHKWPTKVIDQILEWNSKGLGRIGDEFVGLEANRALRQVSMGAPDGRYARVMPRQAAEALKEGGTFAKPFLEDGNVRHIAFASEAHAIDGITSRQEIAEKLSLFNEDGTFRNLVDEVVVEWKFKGDEPFLNLASPFGEAGTLGPGFLPTGSTAGGVPEWVIQNNAVEQGLIDLDSLKIRELTDP